MPNSMNIYKPSKISQQPAIIIVLVLFVHLILIWCLSYLIVPYSLHSASAQQPITVRFISTAKTNQTNTNQATTAQVAPQIPTEMSVKTTSNSSTAVVNKTLLSSPNSAKTMATSSQQQIQPNPAVNAKSNTQQPSPLTQGKAEPSTASSTSTGASTATTQSATVDTQDHQVKPSNQSLSEPTQPLQVSQVDVMRFGKLNYNDRELQQQSRRIILTISIDSKGKPIQIVIKQGSGIDHLDQMAIKAAQKSQFKPHKLNGQAVAVVVDFSIELKLNQRRG